MFDTEKFIIEVQRRPNLWQSDNKSYYNRFQRRLSWEDLAQGMYENWEKYSKRRKDDIVEELQKKWRNLRDYHIKLRKKDKVLKRKASYLELLQFLDVPGESYSSPVPAKKVRSETDDEIEDSDEQISNMSRTAEGGYDVQVTENIEPEVFPTMINNVTSLSEDPDRSFLISILPHIQTMDEKQKFKFKLKTMKLIDKIKYAPEHQEDYDPLINEELKAERSDSLT